MIFMLCPNDMNRVCNVILSHIYGAMVCNWSIGNRDACKKGNDRLSLLSLPEGGIMNRWFLQNWCKVNSNLDQMRVASTCIIATTFASAAGQSFQIEREPVGMERAIIVVIPWLAGLAASFVGLWFVDWLAGLVWFD